MEDFRQARELVSNRLLLEAAGFNDAQVAEVRAFAGRGDLEGAFGAVRQAYSSIDFKSAEVLAQRERAGKAFLADQENRSASERMLEDKGVLPPLANTAEGWRVRYRDGSNRVYQSKTQADAARWQWARDREIAISQKFREAVERVESTAELDSEFILRLRNEGMTIERFRRDNPHLNDQVDVRIQQGKALAPGGQAEATAGPQQIREEETLAFEESTAMSTATASSAEAQEAAGVILGTSVSEYLDGMHTTTMTFYKGHTAFTAMEEMVEGKAKKLLALPGKREWMRRALREVEERTGQQIFRTRDDAQLKDSDLVEAWSHLSLSLYVGRSARGEELAQGFDEKGYRRTMMELLGTEAGPALRSQRTLLEGVYRRAAALNGLKKQGVLDAELESTLAWQLGLEGRTQAAVEADAEAGAEFDAGNAETQLSEPTFSVIPGDPRGPRQDKPSSWDDVKPRHLWASAKQYLPKLDDPRPAFGIKRGTWDHLVRSLANWLRIMPPVKDPWGTSVKLDNPQERGGFQDPMENRAAHLLGADTNKGTESRVLDQEKLDWVGAVRKTISDAQVRVRAGAETLYFRSYKDGVHMVVTADGAVQEQRVLITQYAPELSKGKFQGAVVEKTRNPRLAPQGSPGAVGIRAQPQPQTVQTPQPGTQGDLTSEEGVGQAENVVAPVPESKAGAAALPPVEVVPANVTPVTASAPADGRLEQGPGVAGDSNMTLSLVQNDSRNLPDLIGLAGRPGKGKEWAETAPLTTKQRQMLEEATGQSLDQYTRAVDRGGLRQVYTQHGPGSGDAHPITEEDLQSLPEIVTAPGAVTVDPDDGLGYTTLRHVRFHNGWWYQYTEEVRGGKSGQKALVLTDLSKVPGELMANDGMAAGGAGAATSQTMMAEARERLREVNRQLRDDPTEEDGQGEQGDGVHLDEGGREEGAAHAPEEDIAKAQEKERDHQRTVRLSDLLNRVLSPERRIALRERAAFGLHPNNVASLETKFQNSARKHILAEGQSEPTDLEAEVEKIYQEIFGKHAVPQGEATEASQKRRAVQSQVDKTLEKYHAAIAAAGLSGDVNLAVVARNTFIEEATAIEGGPPNLNWRDPHSEPTFKHAFSDKHGHGQGLEDKRMIDRARGEGVQIGRYRDDQLAAAYAGAISKQGPGIYDVMLPRGLEAVVALPDGKITFGDMMRVVVGNKGEIHSTYPFNSRYSTTPTKRKDNEKADDGKID
ncbi:hypothetical protein [Verrucomicrobium spinosum]|uniref:hypothetical protein n=1 Tax=Verrucomicrobium spinosum TaxID=2736 RepID=UPI000174445F|nr:hypothetical protein [Verrucomicrobium spinosum]